MISSIWPERKTFPLDEIKLKTEMIRRWNKPVIKVCRSDNRSAVAKGIFTKAGIGVYNGGAWHLLEQKKV